MRSFSSGLVDSFRISQEFLRTARFLGEFKGREELYRAQTPQVLETLRQAAVIQSTESSNRIEGVTAPAKRIRDLVQQKTIPRDRPEQEIAGYRDVLTTIHTNQAEIPLSTGVVRQFHRDLFKFTTVSGGKWKATDNAIEEELADGTRRVRFDPVPAWQTAEAMEKLHTEFDRHWNHPQAEPLILIPAYVLDFLCIHPFQDGNGRMARLLTLLLLYKAGYHVGRYISLELLVEQSRESYYDSLYQSSKGWHEGAHDLQPWVQYFAGLMVAAYGELEERVGSLSAPKGAKTQMVLDAIGAFRTAFSVSELMERCPSVGVDLVRRILREQKQAGRVECLGRGPTARWRAK